MLLAVALPLAGAPEARYAGAAACAKCHATIHRGWSESGHARMMRAATPQTVAGDFSQPKAEVNGSTYLLRHSAAGYFITESDLRGRPWEHRVEYTLGTRRIQHYLSTLPDGRILVIPATWDLINKRWTRDIDIANPEESPGGQVWNKLCYGCHVSRERKNFDLAQLRYDTKWQALGIDCESCHGPAGDHVAKPAAANIVNPARLTPARSLSLCAECHSLRDLYIDAFQPGDDALDSFLPVMDYRLPPSDDPAYWPDGRPRWFNNEAIALTESKCYLKGGATCVTCHASHGGALSQAAQTCAKCHAPIAANVSAHSHHAPKSAGSSCIECHMPPAVAGLHASIRDHSLSIPVPENTVRHSIPNACNLCHRDRDAVWAARQVAAWYGPESGRGPARRADAFAAARKSDPASVPLLLQILGDSSEAPFIRANAAGYLGAFPNDPAAYDAVLHSVSDPDPLVRAIAGSSLRPRAAQRETAAPALLPLLRDPLRTLSMSAAIALVAMGVREIPGEDGDRFRHAKDLYRARAALNADDPDQQFAAGKFFFLAGDMDSAAAAFDATLKLDPQIPARYLLARALQEKGDLEGARRTLQQIGRDDPQYSAAQTLLAEVELALRTHSETQPKAGTPADAGAAGRFLNGQLQYLTQYYAAALTDLDEALRLAPNASWAHKAHVYRAVCLEKLARTAEAETIMRDLAAQPGAPRDVDLQLAYVELLYDTGRAPDALKRVDELIAGVPDAPMALFWRAKVLLALRRIPEAAAAAEESVRLMPQAPNSHNLLIRIYQMLGRANEAGEQAEWLREYERRLKSR